MQTIAEQIAEISNHAEGTRYLDRHGDTWGLRAGGSHFLHIARADEGNNPDPNCHRWFESADTVTRDFGPMTPIDAN